MSTALVTRPAPRFVRPIAQSGGMVMWDGTDPTTVTTDPQLSWGDGAPNHTAPANSVFFRLDAAGASTWLYRNTDSGTTWSATVAAGFGDTNTWTAANTFSHATGVTTDTITERTAAAGVTIDGLLLKDGSIQAAAIADPGTGVAIPVTKSGSVAITTAAAETNTLAIPTFLGQTLTLFVNTYAVGDRVVTASQRINQANNTIMTFGAVGDVIKLEAITIGGALRWQVVANDGVALS